MLLSWDREYDLPDEGFTDAYLAHVHFSDSEPEPEPENDDELISQIIAHDVAAMGAVFMDESEDFDPDDDEDEDDFDVSYEYTEDDDDDFDFDLVPEDGEDDGYGDEA